MKTRWKGRTNKMYDLPEEPGLKRMMRTGMPSWPSGAKLKYTYKCPVCRAELEADEAVYTKTIDGETVVIGCEDCITVRTAEGVYA
jgi:hypothetical protein